MREVDLETLKDIEVLWTEDGPSPDPARRRAIRARALSAFEKTHQRGIGAAVARHLWRSTSPLWRQLTDTLDSPWTETVLRLVTSLIAAIAFTAALVSALMIVG